MPSLLVKCPNVQSRCRWCANGFCEDCIDWDNTTLVGDTLDEYQVLEFPVIEQAYYIVCSYCNEGHDLDDVYTTQAQFYKDTLAKKHRTAASKEDVKEEDLPNLTDAATTAYGSEVSTPADFGVVPTLLTIAMAEDPKLEPADWISKSASLKRKKEEEFVFGFMKVDKQRLLTPKGATRKKADRMGSGTKRTFAELVDKIDGMNEEDTRKKGRASLGAR